MQTHASDRVPHRSGVLTDRDLVVTLLLRDVTAAPFHLHAWQVAFFIIARDPPRFRPIMIPSILEKIGYGGAVVVLYAQGRMHGQDLAFGLVDLMFAALFAVAFLRTARAAV